MRIILLILFVIMTACLGVMQQCMRIMWFPDDPFLFGGIFWGLYALLIAGGYGVVHVINKATPSEWEGDYQ